MSEELEEDEELEDPDLEPELEPVLMELTPVAEDKPVAEPVP